MTVIVIIIIVWKSSVSVEKVLNRVKAMFLHQIYRYITQTHLEISNVFGNQA